ncbi:MFS transporter, partial [Myxococcota bacterium]|nr:MFS transporter [Myxococcota bacterium]
MTERRPLPAIHRVFPKVYYGWIVVGGTFLQLMVCVGIGFYSQQVLVDALPTNGHFERVEVSAASSLFFLLTGLFGFGIGPLIDRAGARGFIFAGALIQGIALIWIGRLGSPQQLPLAFALLALGFALSTSVPTGALLTRWFIARRAMATTLSQTGVSVGGALMIPIATYWILHKGLAVTTAGLAAAIALVTIPVVIFVLRWDPRAYGLEPDGSLEWVRRSRHLSLSVQHREWQRREALQTSTFWKLCIAFGFGLAAQVGMIAHQLAALSEQIPREIAMWGGSLIPIGSVIGRLIVGSVADRFEKRRVAIGLFLLQGLGICSFSFSTSPTALFASTALFGLTIGSIFMLQSLITADLFGIPSFGRVFGAVQLGSQLISSTGPLVVGWLFMFYGGYPAALRWLAVSSLLGAAILSQIRGPIEETGGPRKTAPVE